jgi:mannose-1-phosphate guanylyltransferase / phosphomannomutase
MSQAIILAGGKGTRIAEIRGDIPKPMIPICGKPILEYQVESLANSGITNILIITNHLGKKIEQFFAKGSKWNTTIAFFRETTFLGTAGALPLVADQLSFTATFSWMSTLDI